MGPFSTIGIDNNFSASKSSVAMRPTNDKFSCRIYVVFDIISKQTLNALRQLFLDTRHQYIDDIVLYFFQHYAILVEVIVLGGNYNCIDACGLVIIVVFN